MNELFVTYNLACAYLDPGEFEFKLVLSPAKFKSSHASEVTLFDSDGREMPLSVDKWGRKIRCSFSLTDDVPDGVCQVRLSLVDDRGKKHADRLNFWWVKP